MWQTQYALAVPKNLGVGVKTISSLGVRSPWFSLYCNKKAQLIAKMFHFYVNQLFFPTKGSQRN